MSAYAGITELPGDPITQEQWERLCHRYFWVGTYCVNKDVLEVACGSGIGAGYLSNLAARYVAGDYDEAVLKIARAYYGERVDFRQFDAQDLPFGNDTFDVVVMLEAIYYVPHPEKFVRESKRVLRNGGYVLLATANKDLYDFAPSPYSIRYFGVPELRDLFSDFGFSVECFGYLSVNEVSLRQRILRPVKKFAVATGLMPKTKEGKKWLKRIVFGKVFPMPAEIKPDMIAYHPPTPIPLDRADKEHKVIYCAAKLEEK